MRNNTKPRWGRLIQSCLTPDLLKPAYRQRAQGKHRHYGHCYVASEAYFHIRGGMASQWRPMVVRHEGSTHWFLHNRATGRKVDLTKAQFLTAVPYSEARYCGFLTGKPSKRTRQLIERVLQKAGRANSRKA